MTMGPSANTVRQQLCGFLIASVVVAIVVGTARAEPLYPGGHPAFNVTDPLIQRDLKKVLGNKYFLHAVLFPR